MALTEDEKRTIKAYNMGYTLNNYEPWLLDQIIKNNPDNDFVRAMQVGRDHNEFHHNIPREYSKEFKTGFYNGRTLAQFSPDAIDKMMKTDGLSKDFKNGLAAAKTAYNIRVIKDKSALEKAQQNPANQAPAWLEKKQQPEKSKAPAKAKGKNIDMDR